VNVPDPPFADAVNAATPPTQTLVLFAEIETVGSAFTVAVITFDAGSAQPDTGSET
jgi:hypothetical protein